MKVALQRLQLRRLLINSNHALLMRISVDYKGLSRDLNGGSIPSP